MKIVYCIPSTYNSGGMERVLAKKANYLSDILNWEVTVITTSQHTRSSFYTLSKRINTIDLGINYDEMMTLPLLSRIASRLKAKKRHKRALQEVLEDIRPDITVSMFTHEMSFLPSIPAGGRKVLELHFSKNFRALDDCSNNRPMLLRLINRILDCQDRRQIRKYDRFVVLSERDAHDWGVRYGNMSVISNPSTFEDTTLTDYKNKKALAIGRLCPQKGFDMLVKIWSLLPEKLKEEWHLDIVGSGPDYDKLSQLISGLGLSKSISILPPSKDVSKLYQTHSIFCFPSRYEGFGLSLMEAMSFGLATVAYDCPCGPSEMIANGKNGYLVAVDNLNVFKSRLQTLMENEDYRCRLGKSAQNDIVIRFSENTIMEQWTNLFNELTKKEI